MFITAGAMNAHTKGLVLCERTAWTNDTSISATSVAVGWWGGGVLFCLMLALPVCLPNSPNGGAGRYKGFGFRGPGPA